MIEQKEAYPMAFCHLVKKINLLALGNIYLHNKALFQVGSSKILLTQIIKGTYVLKACDYHIYIYIYIYICVCIFKKWI